MKHLHFNVEPDGFYGAYWACDGGGGLRGDRHDRG